MATRQKPVPTIRRTPERGQILVLFALSFGAILLMAALLLDGAYSYVERRQLQDAGDAAALSAANLLDISPRGCSATFGPPPGVPRTDVLNAALASVAANLPGFPVASVTVTCPAEWGNSAVRVQLGRPGANFLEQAVGGGPLSVATTSTAINGRVTSNVFSVVLLDPWDPSWPQGRRGCPAMLFSGGPTVTFDGSIGIDSACPAANGGALGTNGTASTLTVNNGAEIKIVGGYNPSALTITPAPLTGQPYYPDPLRRLPAVPVADLPQISTSRLILNNETQVLQPGVYTGGIQLRNTSTALLRPGIYVLDGGGLDVGAQATICSISGTSSATDCATWSSNCGDTDCGVLLFNRGTQSGNGAMGQVTVGAGSTLRLKAYDERAIPSDVTSYSAYRNLLLWQDASPPASSTYAQPEVALNGGGNIDIGGTVYAPQAVVVMNGTSGGSQGGGDVELTLQFISWDLNIQGNAHFRFFYHSDQFVAPLGYGLVE